MAFARDHNACREARSWLNTQTDPPWRGDVRAADWMIWFARRRSVERKGAGAGSRVIARTALWFVPEGKMACLAIETAERWTRGRGDD